MAFVDKPFRTQVSIRIGHRGSLMSSSDHFALSFADSVFGGGSFNSKLMQEIRVKRGWSYGAYSSFKYGTQPRSWTLSMEVSNKDAPAALAYTLNMIKEFSSQGISAEEFAFGKNNIINSAGFSYNTPKKRSENKLLESIFKLPEGFMKWAAPQTERLTLEQVNAVIKRFFNPNELAVLTLGTASDSKQALVKAAAVEETNVSTIPYDKD